VSAAILLAELEYAGIRLQFDGPHLVADVLPHTDLDLYRELIVEQKPALLAELTPLDAEVIASEASHRSYFEIAQRIARIEVRIGTTDELRADRLALRYWRAIDRHKRETERDT
jgi:hypothetical protein